MCAKRKRDTESAGDGSHHGDGGDGERLAAELGAERVAPGVLAVRVCLAEVGTRLGQISEFSLLIAALALSVGILSERASFLIQAATLVSFVVSSYVIMLRYPTPIAVSDNLRRD